MAKQNLEQRTKRPYVVALPKVDITEVPQYSDITKTGTTIATTEADAIGNYLFRNLQKIPARTIMSRIRDELGGYEQFAMALPEDIPTNQIIEIATFLSGVYKDRNPRGYETKAEGLLAQALNIPQ